MQYVVYIIKLYHFLLYFQISRHVSPTAHWVIRTRNILDPFHPRDRSLKEEANTNSFIHWQALTIPIRERPKFVFVFVFGAENDRF